MADEPERPCENRTHVSRVSRQETRDGAPATPATEQASQSRYNDYALPAASTIANTVPREQFERESLGVAELIVTIVYHVTKQRGCYCRRR